MLLDFDVTHCRGECSATGQSFAPGETYFSTLHMEGGAPVRRDYAARAWQGPPTEAIAWWKSRAPADDGAKPKLAPRDVLLNLLAEMADRPDEAEFRYVLGLLLMRRRLVKLEETRSEADGDVLVLHCPRREEQYEVPVAPPAAEQTEALERRMIELLYGGA